MAGGRPNEYKPEYVDKVDEYLASNQDEEVQVVKQANNEKGYEMYNHKLKVIRKTDKNRIVEKIISVKIFAGLTSFVGRP